MTLLAATLNGRPVDSGWIQDRELAFGDGIFETMRVCQGQIPLWSFHRSRLVEGLGRLSIHCSLDDIERWLNELLGQVHGPDEWVAKLIVTRGLQGQGSQPDPKQPATCLVMGSTPVPVLNPKDYRLRLCQHRLPIHPLLAGLKTLNRLDQVLARLEWQQEYDEGILLDYQGNVVEGVTSNVFWESGGKLFTPMLNNAGVCGVMRRWVMSHADVTEVIEPKLETLLAADSLFVTNALRGLMLVAELDHPGENGLTETTGYQPSPTVLSLQQQLHQELYSCAS